MNLNDLTARLAQAAQRIQSEAGKEAAVAGQDIVALVSNRVIQRGESASGQPFTPYSTKEVPAYLYIGKGRRASTDAKLRQKSKKKEPVSYKEFRELDGLNTDKKNFEFTGEMWRKFGVKTVTQESGDVVILLGGTTNASADKITWLSEQEKQSIIAPNQDELDTIARHVQNWLGGIIQQAIQ